MVDVYRAHCYYVQVAGWISRCCCYSCSCFVVHVITLNSCPYSLNEALWQLCALAVLEPKRWGA